MTKYHILSRPLGVIAMALAIQACSDTPAGPDAEGTRSPLNSVTQVQITGFAAAPSALNGMPWVGSVPGFTSPMDGVASPDGSVFYFTAFTDEAQPRAAIFSVPSAGGQGTLLHAGGPLGYPSGLLMSCDGRMLYIADRAVEADEDASLGSDPGGIYQLSASGGELTRMDIDGLVRPSGLAMGNDCSSLFVTERGYAEGGGPALVRASAVFSGGQTISVTRLHSGDPLASPSGVYVDENDVAWVMDQKSDDGEGALFSITSSGVVEVVVSGLRLGAPGGVSLNPGGMEAVIPTRGSGSGSGLRTVNLTTGAEAFLPTPQVGLPGGIRTARNGERMILVDNGGSAIYRVE